MYFISNKIFSPKIYFLLFIQKILYLILRFYYISIINTMKLIFKILIKNLFLLKNKFNTKKVKN